MKAPRQSMRRQFDLPDNMPMPELFKKFFEEGIPDLGNRDAQSLGSGFILSNDGYIMTNNHVIKDADAIEVRLSDRRVFEAELIGSDPDTDVAVIKIDAKNLPVVKIGSSDKLRVGEWVLAIGSPFGFDHSVTAGIVSAKGRNLPRENYVPFIQTDVAINPGNSGGPLFNLDGEVVGINSQIFSRSGGFMGLSFSIPIELAMDVANQIRSNGSVSRGYLGVLIQDVDNNLADSFGLDKPRGALVSKVLPNTPASDAGLEVGDIITKFNGINIRYSSELPPIVGRSAVEKTHKLEIIRNGKTITKSIKVAQLPKDGIQVNSSSSAPKMIDTLGVQISDLTSDEREASGMSEGGAVIREVSPSSRLAAVLKAGDIVKIFDRQSVKNADQLQSMMEEAMNKGTVAALIIRDGNPAFVALTIGR
jgi:serine protease Do